MRRALSLGGASLLLGWCLVGCGGGGGSAIHAPSLSPSSAASAALAEADANKDQLLDEEELKKLPGLLAALSDVDENKDKKLSADEIRKRLELYRESNVGIMSVSCRVMMDDRPLGNASVRLIPEPFLGSGFKPASGTSEPDGTLELKTEGYDLPGVPCGFYRVEVSKSEGGRELVPAKYRSPTTLGLEIGPAVRGEVLIKVKSR